MVELNPVAPLVVSEQDPTEVFKREWNVYQACLDNDCLEHRHLYDSVATELAALREKAGRPLNLLDLGCGDADYLCRMLSIVRMLGMPDEGADADGDAAMAVDGTPDGAPDKAPDGSGAGQLLGSYTGVDLSAQALSIAKDNLEDNLEDALGSGAEMSLVEGDMLTFVRAAASASAAAGAPRYDVVFASFALHHLTIEDKAVAVAEAAAATAGSACGGALVVVDIFRREGEEREGFLARYVPHMASDWKCIDDVQKETIRKHVVAYDFPETVSAYEGFAASAGFSTRGLVTDSTAGFSKLFVAHN
ncbi:hypothetical protein FOA52_013211 [Chlamydomonas sp. UWO 241]|nr:hypothetical protein FOA52_013211 [Chlamydomonas sp. UWO 241]